MFLRIPLVVAILAMGLFSMPFAIGCSRSAKSAGQHAGHSSNEEHVAHDEAEVEFDESKVITPPRYIAAVGTIDQGWQSIKQAIEAQKPHDAHQPLDETDVHLRRLMNVARGDNISRQNWESINLAAKRLRIALGEIHTAIDEEQTPDLPKANADVAQCLKTLRDGAKSVATETAAPTKTNHVPSSK